MAKRGWVTCWGSHSQNLDPGLRDSLTAALNHWVGDDEFVSFPQPSAINGRVGGWGGEGAPWGHHFEETEVPSRFRRQDPVIDEQHLHRGGRAGYPVLRPGRCCHIAM